MQSQRKRILITGAAGRIGTALRKYLQDYYEFRLVLRSTIPGDIRDGEEIVMADVCDLDSMIKAAKNVNVIIHLALRRWPQITNEDVDRVTYDIDMRGTWNIFEAARINNIPTVVFASTNHVTGMYEKEGTLSHPDLPIRPDSMYAVGKAFGEVLGRFYSEHYRMRVFCLRVGNFNGKLEPGRHYNAGYSRWQSPRDLGNMVKNCIEREDIHFGIFYGVSKGGEKVWDITNAETLLGYEPLDDGLLPQLRVKNIMKNALKKTKRRLRIWRQRFVKR